MLYPKEASAGPLPLPEKWLSFLRFQSSELPFNLSSLISSRKVMILWIIWLFLVVRVGATPFPAFYVLSEGRKWEIFGFPKEYPARAFTCAV